jgi:hypothetical protein
MSADHSKKVTDKIEALCRQGCTHVKQILAMAKDGKPIEELSDFDRTETEEIITELDHIMSVYDEKPTADDEIKSLPASDLNNPA